MEGSFFMTRRTLKELRSNKGPDKWVAVKDEFDKMVEGPGDSYKVAGGSASLYNATPGVSVATGLTSITGFGVSVISPVTPNYLQVNCTPIAGDLVCSVTPADAVISYFAVGQ